MPYPFVQFIPRFSRIDQSLFNSLFVCLYVFLCVCVSIFRFICVVPSFFNFILKGIYFLIISIIILKIFDSVFQKDEKKKMIVIFTSM